MSTTALTMTVEEAAKAHDLTAIRHCVKELTDYLDSVEIVYE